MTGRATRASRASRAARYVATVSGTSSSHIVLTGPAAAAEGGVSSSTGYGFHLNGVRHRQRAAERLLAKRNTLRQERHRSL